MPESDKGIGVGLLFAIVAVIAAAATLGVSLQGQQVLSGWGLVAALVAAGLAIVGIHAYD